MHAMKKVPLSQSYHRNLITLQCQRQGHRKFRKFACHPIQPLSRISNTESLRYSSWISYTQEPILYLQMAFTASFFAGVFQASVGILRLEFVIDFLSKATLTGFIAGAATTERAAWDGSLH